MKTAAWRTRHNPIANADSTPSISWFSISIFFYSPFLSLPCSLFFSICLPLSSSFFFLSVPVYLLPFPTACILDWRTFIPLFSLFLFFAHPVLWLTALMHLHRAAPTGFNPRGELFSFCKALLQVSFKSETMKSARETISK